MANNIKVLSGIFLSTSTFNCGKDSDSMTVTYTLTSGYELGEVVSNATWVQTLVSTSNNVITIKVGENAGNESRQAQISVSATNGDLTSTKYIYINQSTDEESSAYINASTTNLTFNCSEESRTFTYTAYSCTDVIVICQASWATIKVSGTTVTVTAKKNEGAKRDSSVLLQGYDSNNNPITTQVFILQVATDVAPSIVFDPSTVYLGEGEERSYQYGYYTMDNCTPYEYVYSDSWLHEGSGNLLNDGKVRYYYDANTGASRTATITIKAKSDIDLSEMTAVLKLVQDKYSGYVKPIGDITFIPSTQTINYIGGELTYDFELANITDLSSISATTSYDWLSANYDGEGSTISVTVSHSDVTNERCGTITVDAIGTDGLGCSAYIYVVQTAAPETIERPIWKDTDLSWETTSTYDDYIVSIDGKQVYSGRAYSKDGVVSVRVSDILKDKIDEEIDWDTTGLQNVGGYIYGAISVSGTDKYQLKFYRDWSYEDEKKVILSEPISYVVDARQYIPLTIAGFASSPVQVTQTIKKQGSSARRTTTYNIANGFYTINQHGYQGTMTYKIGDEELTFNMSHTCYDYALYYLNARGGYDSLLLKGKVLNKQGITTLQYSKNSYNYTKKHQLVDYKKTIKKTWEANTSYLTDAQSELAYKNIYGSTQMWLHDFNTDEIYPVVITDNSADLKTFKNQGRKFFMLTFKLQLAQDRFRI